MMTKVEILKLVDEALEPIIDTRDPVATPTDRMAKTAYVLGMLKGKLEADEPSGPGEWMPGGNGGMVWKPAEPTAGKAGAA